LVHPDKGVKGRGRLLRVLDVTKNATDATVKGKGKKKSRKERGLQRQKQLRKQDRNRVYSGMFSPRIDLRKEKIVAVKVEDEQEGNKTETSILRKWARKKEGASRAIAKERTGWGEGRATSQRVQRSVLIRGGSLWAKLIKIPEGLFEGVEKRALEGQEQIGRTKIRGKEEERYPLKKKKLKMTEKKNREKNENKRFTLKQSEGGGRTR